MESHYQQCQADQFKETSFRVMDKKNPFQSFWIAGYECTDQLNAFGNRVDFLNLTGHLQLLEQDYKNLSLFQMSTVREGIRWSQIEKTPYHYDWSVVEAMITTAKDNHIQQVWDLCHFGFPDDLTPLHPMFARRFAALCKAFVNFYRNIDAFSELIITPINEVSFLAWLGGDVRGTSPFCVGQGWNVKYHLMKAYIEGVEALKEADPSVRILTTEPLVNIVPALNATPQEILDTNALNQDQFQITDMLSGRMCPELRGKPEYLDILGYNYYFNNQWIHNAGVNEFLDWKKNINISANNPLYDPSYMALHKLLDNAYQRYPCPIVLTETSHPKEDRPLWIEMITQECSLTISSGIPLWGVCWYPILNRPDWDHLEHWHYSGIWDDEFTPENLNTDSPQRILAMPTAKALLKAQDVLQQTLKAYNR
jgi:hypothetical protein